MGPTARADNNLHLLFSSKHHPSENGLTSRENLVEGFFEKGGRIGKLFADITDKLLPALLDFFVEDLLEVALFQGFFPLVRLIHNHVGNERPGEPPRFLMRIPGQERVGALVVDIFARRSSTNS